MKEKSKKLLVANRGEIACRIFDTCRLLGIETWAIAPINDMSSRHVVEADHVLPLEDNDLISTYLNQNFIIQLAVENKIDLIHPGYGFLAESSSFAQAVMDSGITWVGPQPKVIEQMGSKIESKILAEKAEVPVLPWAVITNDMSTSNIESRAKEIGYPLLVKASYGGGGKGMRVVKCSQELMNSIQLASKEALASFGNGTVFLEKWIENPRHIEVQVIGDKSGNVFHLFERECSVQRRHQKVIEEAPACNILPEIRELLHKSAVMLSKFINYDSIGTVEFILEDPSKVYFLEMNTRIQVEHPVTEMITGADLVEIQIRSSLGENLEWFTKPNISLLPFGHAIECRIYAEDPSNNFVPSPGPILQLDWPTLKNARIDTGVIQGGEVSSEYDPMVAKVCAWGNNKEEAIKNIIQILDKTTLLGFTHNIEFLKTILTDPSFQQSVLTTKWVGQNLEKLINDNAASPATILAMAVSAVSNKNSNASIQSNNNSHNNNGNNNLRFVPKSLFEEISLSTTAP